MSMLPCVWLGLWQLRWRQAASGQVLTHHWDTPKEDTVMHRVAFRVEAKGQRDVGVGLGLPGEVPELSRQLKRVEKPGQAREVKSSLLAAWFCSQCPWCVLKMFIGTVIKELYLMVLYLIPSHAS